MQAMQCVQLPPQRGLPPDNVMFFRGQSLTHAPQPVQSASETTRAKE